MSDAFLLTVGAVLMQKDTNGDLHPCTYFSKTFSLAEHNYDIYDRELLAIILAITVFLSLLPSPYGLIISPSTYGHHVTQLPM